MTTDNPKTVLHYGTADIMIKVDDGGMVLIITAATATRLDAAEATKLADAIKVAAGVAAELQAYAR